MAAPRHFLDLSDFDGGTLRGIIDMSRRLKEARAQHRAAPAKVNGSAPLAGRTLAMIFERESTRTRVSFDMAMRELGGGTIVLSGADLQLGRGETIADTARVLSRYVDAVMIRTLDHDGLKEFARHASVPVLNGLTRRSHPCQVMADILTFEEHRGPVTGRRIAWVGDANNVLASFIHASALFGFTLAVAAPKAFQPSPALLAWARENGADVEAGDDPRAAVAGAAAVVTDTWVSMGDGEEDARHATLAPFRVTDELMALAEPDAIFMHCLPAHRGEEVTASVIDGPRSAVFDEAENRLHAQKGILAWCFGVER